MNVKITIGRTLDIERDLDPIAITNLLELIDNAEDDQTVKKSGPAFVSTFPKIERE